MQKVPHFMKTNKTRSICVYTCTIYTYMHHQIPPKYDIPSWPSLCTLWKTRSKWEICVESAIFVVFQVLFSPFHEKCTTFHTKSATFHDQVNMCVYMIHHIHHQIPPKYKIYLVAFPLYSWHQVEIRDLCFESAVFVAFVLFIEGAGFLLKVPLFMKTNKTRSICVYTWTIYTYMHHHIPKKKRYT